MKLAIPLVLLLAAGLLCGCSAGQAYAKKHPELPPQQLQFLRTGKVPEGDGIAGMTREQVQIAMGMEPTQYTKVDGHDAWVYVRKSLGTTALTTDSASELDRRDNRTKGSLLGSETPSPQNSDQTKITIVFDGDVAIHAETIKGGL